MQIDKYELTIAGKTKVEIPKGSKILSVQSQDEGLVVWALLPPDEHFSYIEREFVSVPTGGVAEEYGYLEFLDTVQFNDGNFVVHVFVNPV